MFRNHMLIGDLVGLGRYPANTAGGTVMLSLGAISSFFMPWSFSISFRIITVSLILLSVLIMAIIARRKLAEKFYDDLVPIAVTSTFLVAYAFFLIFASSFFAIYPGGYSGRYWVPVYPLLIFLVLKCLDDVIVWTLVLTGHAAITSRIFTLVYCLWLGFPVYVSARHFVFGSQRGVNVIDEARWVNSDTIDWLRKNPLPGKVFSNNPFPLYLFAHLNTRRAPFRTLRRSELQALIPHGHQHYLVWFYGFEDNRFYTLRELALVFNIEEFKHFSDSTVFVLGNKNDTDK